MENKSNNIKWNREKKAYFFIYKDKDFLKNIYSQMFDDFPDVGLLSYIGANTHRISKDYSAEGEKLGEDELISRNPSKECPEKELNNKKRNGDRKKAGLLVCDSKECSEIREYANIHEIKEMNNMNFYNQIITKLIETSLCEDCLELCYLYEEIILYEGYKKQEDIYVKMGDTCIWLKTEYVDADIVNISKFVGRIHMIGYVISNKTEDRPRIVRAMSLFI